jgi:hypothetical protein
MGKIVSLTSGASIWVSDNCLSCSMGVNRFEDERSWTQVKLDTAHRRLSHAATQVGSYLLVLGGHDGTTYTTDLLFFNLGIFSRRS